MYSLGSLRQRLVLSTRVFCSKRTPSSHLLWCTHRPLTSASPSPPFSANPSIAPLDTELDLLLSSLSFSASTLKASLAAQGFAPLASNDVAPHPLDIGVPDPTSYYARRAIVNLCQQITALVQDPAERSAVDHFGFLMSACLTAATDTQPPVGEVVLKAGPEGIYLKEISQRTGLDEIKLRSITRILTGSGYFKAVSSDRLAPTRSTRALTPGSSPVTDLDGLIKVSAPMAGVISKVAALPSDSSNPTAFQLCNGAPLFAWMKERPEELAPFHRGLTELESHLDKGMSEDVHLDDFGPSNTLVDIGSGRGGLVMHLLKKYPGWKAILQDREEVLQQAKKFWMANMPEAVDTGRVSFLAHDFFTPTPLPPSPSDSPYVFLIKNVLHNWPDEEVKSIVQNLIPATTSGTPLLILNFTPSTSEAQPGMDLETFFEAVAGKPMVQLQETNLPVPVPLNAGFGLDSEFVSVMDVLMVLLLNSRARTAHEFREILEGTGWQFYDRRELRGASSLLRAHRL